MIALKKRILVLPVMGTLLACAFCVPVSAMNMPDGGGQMFYFEQEPLTKQEKELACGAAQAYLSFLVLAGISRSHQDESRFQEMFLKDQPETNKVQTRLTKRQQLTLGLPLLKQETWEKAGKDRAESWCRCEAEKKECRERDRGFALACVEFLPECFLQNKQHTSTQSYTRSLASTPLSREGLVCGQPEGEYGHDSILSHCFRNTQSLPIPKKTECESQGVESLCRLPEAEPASSQENIFWGKVKSLPIPIAKCSQSRNNEATEEAESEVFAAQEASQHIFVDDYSSSDGDAPVVDDTLFDLE
ncbi:hypothetical protein CVU75_02335 [Candidatus Dependentiae bacterium HGW-Dependentiae-1]|nr:MAG: hypothetical protein CVU75_02335 [Candidatus Dependentiae bacterium HGW-Dependentiae-1]